MTRDLALDIAYWFRYVRPDGLATADEVARGVQARTVDVRRVLRDDARFSGPLASGFRSDKAKLYALAADSADESGRVDTGSVA